MSFDESCLIRFKIFFRVKVVRIILDLMGLCFLTVVYTLFQIVLDYVHLCNYALHAYQLIGQFASHPSRSDKVRTKIAFKTDAKVLDFILEPSLLLSLQVSFE